MEVYLGVYGLTLIDIDTTIRSTQKCHVLSQPGVIGANREEVSVNECAGLKATIKRCWESEKQANRQDGGDSFIEPRIQ